MDAADYCPPGVMGLPISARSGNMKANQVVANLEVYADQTGFRQLMLPEHDGVQPKATHDCEQPKASNFVGFCLLVQHGTTWYNQ